MKELKQVICEALDMNESNYAEDLKLIDIPSWDSLNHMMLITQIEENFEVELSGDEIAELTSIENIKAVLGSKGVELK